MTEPRRIVETHSPEATADLAARVAALLRPGDCLLLDGQIGAGKTHFARHLIRSLQDTPEDVPSPTFTLVQTYDTRAGEVWHADLYRLTAPDEIEELGQAEAFDSAICLIEWPDRLGDLVPQAALRLRFHADTDNEDWRRIAFDWAGGDWAARLKGLADD